MFGLTKLGTLGNNSGSIGFKAKPKFLLVSVGEMSKVLVGVGVAPVWG